MIEKILFGIGVVGIILFIIFICVLILTKNR